ncbi:MAG: PQQ-binding-like beta-propeller repeat protein [Planctomycetaceae bacterium]
MFRPLRWFRFGLLCLMGGFGFVGEGVDQGVADDSGRAQTSAPNNWPNWLGPKWDGVSTETGWLMEWPEAGLPVAWTKEIGIGFSSVSIAEGRLFTMGHVDGREIVYCLNQADGSEIWKFDYPCQLVNNLHEGGPGATPSIDGEFVYTLGREGQLHCLKFKTGELVWKQMLQEDLGVELPEWGFTASPRIVGEMLILEAGRVVAYQKQTGKKLWQTEPHLAGYGSVTPFEHQGVALIASFDCEGLRIVQQEDGKQVAFTPWKSPFRTNSTTPIVVKDTIFISSAYNVGCGLFRLKAGELEPLYAHRDMRNHFNNSILYQGYLYGMDGNSNLGRVVQLTCMNYETGEIAWKRPGFGCGSLIIVDGKLVILSESGELVLAEATHENYQELTRTTILTGRCWTVPVLFQKHLYARNARGKLVAVKVGRMAQE